MADTPNAPASRFVFPKWANYLLPVLVIGALGSGPYIGTLWIFGADAATLNLGYRPEQPVPYSHSLHVGQLGMDCRYCHTTVFDAAFAAIPHTDVCIHCHAPDKADAEKLGLPEGYESLGGVHKNSAQLTKVRDSYVTGEPIEWTKVHDLADYVFFNHAAHVNKGVSCLQCHGRVDQMDEEGVWQAKELSMAWCLECHREPEKHLWPVEQVTNLGWSPLQDERVIAATTAGELNEGDEAAAQLWLGERLKREYGIHDEQYMTACSTCHR